MPNRRQVVQGIGAALPASFVLGCAGSGVPIGAPAQAQAANTEKPGGHALATIHEIELSGPQSAATVRQAIQDAYAAGHKDVGIGRINGGLELIGTSAADEIRLRDMPGLRLHGGLVINSTVALRADGQEIHGGTWLRRGKMQLAHQFKTGDNDAPITGWLIKDTNTIIEDGAGNAQVAIYVWNANKGRIIGCQHRSEVTRLTYDSTTGTYVSGQGFMGMTGGVGLEIAHCRSEVVYAGRVADMISDDFCNFTDWKGPRPHNISIHHNHIIGHFAVCSVSSASDVVANDNTAERCRFVVWLKPGVLSGNPDLVEDVQVVRTAMTDHEGLVWRGIVNGMARNGGRIRRVTVDSVDVVGKTVDDDTVKDMVSLLADTGGPTDGIDGLWVTNVRLTGPSFRYALSTRGDGVTPIRNLGVSNWVHRGGTIHPAHYRLHDGIAPGSFSARNMSLGRESG